MFRVLLALSISLMMAFATMALSAGAPADHAQTHAQELATHASWADDLEHELDDDGTAESTRGVAIDEEEEDAPPSVALGHGAVQAHPAGSEAGTADRNEPTRPRSIARGVDVPPPRRA